MYNIEVVNQNIVIEEDGDILFVTNCLSYANVTNIDLSNVQINTTNSWQVATVTDGDFVSLNMSELLTSRQADGSLPIINLLRPVADSDLINAGTYCGLPYYGSKPDIGTYEFYESGTTTPTISPNKVLRLGTPSLKHLNNNIKY